MHICSFDVKQKMHMCSILSLLVESRVIQAQENPREAGHGECQCGGCGLSGFQHLHDAIR